MSRLNRIASRELLEETILDTLETLEEGDSHAEETRAERAQLIADEVWEILSNLDPDISDYDENYDPDAGYDDGGEESEALYDDLLSIVNPDGDDTDATAPPRA